jgi:hypothetical protein
MTPPAAPSQRPHGHTANLQALYLPTSCDAYDLTSRRCPQQIQRMCAGIRYPAAGRPAAASTALDTHAGRALRDVGPVDLERVVVHLDVLRLPPAIRVVRLLRDVRGRAGRHLRDQRIHQRAVTRRGVGGGTAETIRVLPQRHPFVVVLDQVVRDVDGRTTY